MIGLAIGLDISEGVNLRKVHHVLLRTGAILSSSVEKRSR